MTHAGLDLPETAVDCLERWSLLLRYIHMSEQAHTTDAPWHADGQAFALTTCEDARAWMTMLRSRDWLRTAITPESLVSAALVLMNLGQIGWYPTKGRRTAEGHHATPGRWESMAHMTEWWLLRDHALESLALWAGIVWARPSWVDRHKIADEDVEALVALGAWADAVMRPPSA